MGLFKKYINEFVNEELYYGEVNGLNVYILPKKGFSKFFSMVTVKYGSNDITSVINNEIREYPQGIAHFLEHKLFEEKEGNIFEKFSGLGASPNAFTTFNNTSYYFTCTENFSECLRLLLGFVFNPYFTEENVNKEKGIIEQEIVMYEDSPEYKVYFNALSAMYSKHPVKFDIAGTVESIKEITPELLYECYNSYYNTSNMFLTIVGDVDIDTIEDTIKDLVPIKEKIKIDKYNFNEPLEIKESSKYENMKLSIPNYVIGFKDKEFKLSDEELLKRKICVDIISKAMFGRSSVIFEELYSEGLINDSFSYDYTLEKGYGYFIISGESKSPDKLKDKILNKIEETKKKGIDVEEFKRAKKVLTGYYITEFNSIEHLGSSFAAYKVRDLDIFSYYEILKQINIEDINEILNNIYDINNCIISIVD